MRIAPNSRVPLTNGIAAIIDHPLFQRLRGVRQLGFADRVYPSATHTRFEHSLGVYFRAIHYVHALWGDDFAGEYFRDKVRPRDIRSLLAAALLHDLGQYPYSHVLEDVDRDHNGTLPATSAFSHEALTANLLTQPTFRQDVLRECASGAPDFQHALDSLGVSAEDVASILEGRAFGDLTPAATGILHSIVDGPIDADKLDYLQRDS
ncbi:MAG TPA: HD domain-containing protein, partial [Gemmatimonadaceae bacterium]